MVKLHSHSEPGALPSALDDIAAEVLNMRCILNDSVDLNGAYKVGLAHDVEQALIALAERPQFVEVGGRTFNPADISWMDRTNGHLYLFLKNGTSIAIEKIHQPAFLAWWNEHADVVRLGEGE